MSITNNFRSLLFISLMLVLISGCKTEPKEKQDPEAVAEVEKRPVVEVVTKSMEFYAPDTIHSGWNTFVYKNQSTEPHFILFDKYPEGKRMSDALKEVIPPFDEGMELIMQGKGDQAMEAFGKIPEWYSGVIQTGGTGMIASGGTATSTVNLEPGYYVVECYVKMPDGRFHASMGMMKELIVEEKDSGLETPKANINVSIASTDGITFTGMPTPGGNVFLVEFKDQVVHEHFMGHDVNLVRLEPGTDLNALEAWMNWSVPEGLMSATLPQGVTFLGGANDAPGGTVQYFEADLIPGTYALIAEVPNPGEKGMLKTFSVADKTDAQ